MVNNNLIHFLIPYVTFGGGGGGGGGKGIVIQFFSTKKSCKTMEKHQSIGFSSRKEVCTFII